MLYIVAYDITHPRRLRRVAAACLDFGVRIEKSVFECDLDPSDFGKLWQRLNKAIDPASDALAAYPLCAACAKRILTSGVPRRAPQQASFIF